MTAPTDDPVVPPAVPEVGTGATAAELVRAGLLANVALLVEHEPVARRDEDPEGVHQARVGIRRARSNLRTFRPLLDPAWWRPLDAELKQFAALLGHVRDADVLGERLGRVFADLPELDRPATALLVERLARQRAAAFADLAAELDSPGHRSFLGRLVGTVAEPVFAPGADGDGHGDSLVDRPAVEVVPGLVARPWRRLRRAVRALPAEGAPIEALHELRILAKRARYACDAVRPVIGRPAAKLARSLGGLQDVLGDLHDTAVAEDWLRQAAVDEAAPRATVLAVGLAVARERADGARLREEWPGAWEQVTAVDRAWLPTGAG